MDTDVVLFMLRVASAVVLISLLLAIYWILWREHRATVERLDANRRVYGRLIGMIEADDQYIPTGDTYALLPLTTLGRNPANTIAINDGFASSDHAQIVLKDGRWWLEDRRSRNGTLLNGLPVNEPVILADGDIIGVGSMRFRLRFE